MLTHTLLLTLLTPLITDNVVTRIVPVNPVINEEHFPYIEYQVNYGEPNRQNNYLVVSIPSSIQIDIYATTFDDAIAIFAALFAILDAYHSDATFTPYINFSNSIDIPEELGYHMQTNWTALRKTL